jgi:hypothetical protein
MPSSCPAGTDESAVLGLEEVVAMLLLVAVSAK